MSIVSTATLRKITIVTLAVAFLSFGAVEIHKRFIVPRRQQQAQAPTPPSTTEETVPTPTPAVDRFELVESITGIFEKWEKVPNSSDKYAFLTDPQTGESFPKVRVGFEFSPLYGDGSGRKDATVFAVEKSEEDYEVLGYLKDFTSEEIDKLIKPGDEIKINLKKWTDKVGNVKDEGGNLLAHWLFIKREFGKQAVEEEVGRKIQRT